MENINHKKIIIYLIFIFLISCSRNTGNLIKINVDSSLKMKSIDEIEENIMYNSFIKDTSLIINIQNISKHKVEFPFYDVFAYRQQAAGRLLRNGILNFYIHFYDKHGKEIIPNQGFISYGVVEDFDSLNYNQIKHINTLKSQNICKVICLDKFESVKIELELKFPSVTFDGNYSSYLSYSLFKEINYLVIHFRYPKNYKNEECDVCDGNYKRFLGEIRSQKIPITIRETDIKLR